MFKLYKIIFFNILIIGTLISISSYSWFNMWIGLEINLLSMIPLMKSHNNIYPAESSLKYFITQTLASTIILFAVILMLNSFDYTPNKLNYWFMLILNSGLMTKLGAAPFHAWFPEVLSGLNWLNTLILMTWQKIAPMILIMYNLQIKFLIFIIIISSIISGILSFNQMNLRKFMAYSSINHIAWMLSSMLNYKMMWNIYFMIYTFISMNLIFIFYKMNSFTFNQLFLNLNYNKMMKMFFIFNFMSLGGIPPFLGFLPKWLVINNLISNNFYSLTFILIFFTLLMLFNYTRITLSTISILNDEVQNKYKISDFLMIFFNSTTLLMLLICTSIFNFN
uniref:NADH-ubiquinone oxidoreductase chain 2 n=1 Tax=Hoplasoma unicolor TaxID=281577 RepID=A0A411D9Q0_9CUCU|nr:NADH dehydrogenase subunit 2 [Hoplasoma unicolor]QAY81938.1 NADH dehydrogenase subunit 2 [Hoplasoma unicolor]